VVETRYGDGQSKTHFHYRILVGGVRFLGVDVFARAHFRRSRAKKASIFFAQEASDTNGKRSN